MLGLLRRHGYQIAVGVLLGVIVSAGMFLLLVALPELQRAASPSAAPSPSASPPSLVMAWVDLPPDADCAACHMTEGGVGLRDIPKIAHPLQAWTDCTACHANDRLVATAPGHAGIHATDCLICHEPADLPPPLSRPHRELQNQDCLDCHGRSQPLPADMAHRPESVCWLCHRLPDQQPPLPAHAISVGQADCLNCHVDGNVGALPADHRRRTPDQCLLCHGAQPGSSPAPSVAPGESPPAQQGMRWPIVVVVTR